MKPAASVGKYVLLSYSCPEEGRLKPTQHGVPKEPTFPLKRNQDMAGNDKGAKSTGPGRREAWPTGQPDPSFVSEEAPSFLGPCPTYTQLEVGDNELIVVDVVLQPQQHGGRTCRLVRGPRRLHAFNEEPQGRHDVPSPLLVLAQTQKLLSQRRLRSFGAAAGRRTVWFSQDVR